MYAHHKFTFAGWQAGHGDAKHLGRASLLHRAPAPQGAAE